MSEQQIAQPENGLLNGAEQKYISFVLDGETYALPILQVQEIISDYEITVFPNLPDFFHGVISLRGEAIPVINLRKRFDLPPKQKDRKTRVLIIEMEPNPIGVQVDEVQRVVSITGDQFEKPPSLTCNQRTEFISGVAELGGKKFTIVLNMQEILTSLEQIKIKEMSQMLNQAMEDSEPDQNGEDGQVETNFVDDMHENENREVEGEDGRSSEST